MVIFVLGDRQKTRILYVGRHVRLLEGSTLLEKKKMDRARVIVDTRVRDGLQF